MVSPSGRVPERAPDWFFVALEACGGGTPDLGLFLEVYGFIGFFGKYKKYWSKRKDIREESRGGHAPLACGPLEHSPDVIPMPNILINIETLEKKPRSGVPPPQASRATKNQSGARSGTLPEGETITGGHLHHPGGLHDEEGVVHPRG